MIALIIIVLIPLVALGILNHKYPTDYKYEDYD